VFEQLGVIRTDYSWSALFATSQASTPLATPSARPTPTPPPQPPSHPPEGPGPAQDGNSSTTAGAGAGRGRGPLLSAIDATAGFLARLANGDNSNRTRFSEAGRRRDAWAGDTCLPYLISHLVQRPPHLSSPLVRHGPQRHSRTPWCSGGCRSTRAWHTSWRSTGPPSPR
jgi:hypothetical protein